MNIMKNAISVYQEHIPLSMDVHTDTPGEDGYWPTVTTEQVSMTVTDSTMATLIITDTILKVYSTVTIVFTLTMTVSEAEDCSTDISTVLRSIGTMGFATSKTLDCFNTLQLFLLPRHHDPECHDRSYEDLPGEAQFKIKYGTQYIGLKQQYGKKSA